MRGAAGAAGVAVVLGVGALLWRRCARRLTVRRLAARRADEALAERNDRYAG